MISFWNVIILSYSIDSKSSLIIFQFSIGLLLASSLRDLINLRTDFSCIHCIIENQMYTISLFTYQLHPIY